jgi:hypothetical protein
MNWELIFALTVGFGMPLSIFGYFYVKARQTERDADKVLRKFGL